MDSEKDRDEGKVFVQTARSVMEGLDRWQQVSDEEAHLVFEMTKRNELSGGTHIVREFEARWRELTGLEYAISTFNGTTSLYSAYFGLKVGPGDEVICPTYTWICTISPVPFLGARPVFAECVPGGVTVDPEDIRRRITRRTRAIVAVHLWGWVCDMDEIMKISEETGIPVIEDCSHAHGAEYRGRPVGSIGHVGCWSLQGSKPISAGEGGVIATRDPEVFDRACLVGQVNRIKGMDLVTNRYEHLQPLGTGMKFRAHPLGMGVASVQLNKLPGLNLKRATFVEEMEAGMAEIPGLRPIPTASGSKRGGFYGFPVLYRAEERDGVPRQTMIDVLRSEGVAVSSDSYGLLHLLPYFRDGFDLFGGGRGPICKTDRSGFDEPWKGHETGDFPVTENTHEQLIFFPVLSDPIPGAAGKILEAVRKAMDKASRA